MTSKLEFEAPPEDIPDLLEKISLNTSINDNKKSKAVKPSAKEATFGGFKKGFLFQNNSKKKENKKAENVSQKQTLDSKPILDSTPRVSPEVRETKDSKLYQNTMDKKLTEHSTVGDIIEDPYWLSILQEFQENAETAMIKYKDNSQVRNVMTKLCSALGENFLNFNPKESCEEQSMVRRIMENEEVKAAYQCPAVIKMLQLAKKGKNDAVRRIMAGANNEERRHIQTMIDFGLFSFAC